MEQRLKKIQDSPYAKLIGSLLFIALALLAWLYPRDGSYRSIHTSLMTSTQLFSKAGDERLKPLKVSYYNKSIENLSYGKIRFQNNGTIPIERKDYIEDIRINFPKDVEIITFETSIHNAVANVVLIQPNQLSLNTNLFNPGLIFDLEFLFTRASEDLKPLTAEDIKYDFTVYGVTEIPLNTEKILTESEEKNEARSTLRKIWLNARPLAFSVLVILILGCLLLLHKKLFLVKKASDTPNKESELIEKVFVFIFFPLILMALIATVYRIGKLIYIGFF